MTLDFVSEVDRKFFSNNLLTNDDWENTSVDLNDLLDVDCYPADLVKDEDFPMNIDDITLSKDFHDNLLQEYSDSSDSGISSVLQDNIFKQDLTSPYIKHEPLSPSASFSSESSDSQIFHEIQKESPPTSPFSPASKTLTYVEDVLPDLCESSYSPLQTIKSSTQPQINFILNSKVKIQPKPIQSANSQTIKIPKQTTVPAQKTVVITPEEFNKLKANGILKFSQPQCQQPVPVVHSPTVQVDNELKANKRQQRMIKNRESASLSRKRKKEYLQGLEDNLQQFNEHNRRLQEENEMLRRKLQSLQDENDQLKKSIGGSPAKKICLMAIFVMLSWNLMSNDFLIKPISKSELPVVHKGRQLMALKDDTEYSISSLVPEFSWSKLKKFMDDHPLIDNKTLYQFYTCPSYFNKTESIRLADQLSGWMQSHELTKKKTADKRKKTSSKKKINLTTLQKAVRGNFNQQRRHFEHSYQVQLFHDKDRNIWKSIPRRNDTFYVLSFSEDYFLVPATAHNKTMRPRMSLVMPAVGLNDTMQPPPGNVGMMQIDCEVLNTQLIHVHKSSLHQQHNSTFYREGFYP